MGRDPKSLADSLTHRETRETNHDGHKVTRIGDRAADDVCGHVMATSATAHHQRHFPGERQLRIAATAAILYLTPTSMACSRCRDA